MPKILTHGFFFAGLGIFLVTKLSLSSQISPEQMVEKIYWLGQAAIKIQTDACIIYIDPYQIKEKDQADIVLITHPHQDHCSLEDVAKVVTEKTVFVAPKDAVEKLRSKFANEVIVSSPGMKTEIKGIPVEAVAAYNIVKTKFHPKENQWVGYILTVDGVRIYHAGDTERIPEMKTITCDIALLPLGQTYTMNSVEEATEAAIDVKAKIAIPIHFGLYEGRTSDAEEFARLLQGKVKVVTKSRS